MILRALGLVTFKLLTLSFILLPFAMPVMLVWWVLVTNQ